MGAVKTILNTGTYYVQVRRLGPAHILLLILIINLQRVGLNSAVLQTRKLRQ